MATTTYRPKLHTPKEIKQRQLDGSFKKVEVLHYEYKDKNLTIKEIEILAKKLRENINNNDYTARIQLGIITPFGHRSGRFVNVKDKDIHIWNPNDFVYGMSEDEDTNIEEWYNDGKAIPTSFWFNVIKVENAGGCSNAFNDCFYDALVQVFGKYITDIWDDPAKLKKYLNMDRQALVNTEEHIDKIEKKIKTQVFVEGDVIRSPKINSKRTLHLCLNNAHYTVASDSIKPRLKGTSYKEQMPLAYHYDQPTDTCYLYDGKQEYTEELDSVRDIMKNRISSKYFILKVKNKNKLKETYDTFRQQADELKRITNGLVNMYKTGGSIKNTALNTFEHFTKHIPQPDKIQGFEGHIILDTYRGGLMKATPYEGKAYKYDVNSHYASIMTSLMNFPVKTGRFVILTTAEMAKWKSDKGTYFKYGIYKCVIKGNINPFLFYENPTNTYTHIDLALAHFLGYSITLLENGQINFYEYDASTRLSGRMLFKDFVDLFQPIKKEHKHLKIAKQIQNMLWGALSEKRTHKKLFTTLEPNPSNEPIILEHDEMIDNISLLGEDKEGSMKIKYETVKNDDMFVSGFARIMPFITAESRSRMTHLIVENLEDVSCLKRIHTDGFITSARLKNDIPNKGDTILGQLGYEGMCERVVVKNMRLPKEEFIL